MALTPKAFDILVALLERRDRVVDKAELMKLVWPDSFVEEANLSQTIFVLRKTLGEAPDGRPFIDTAPRRGYRFAAAVREASAEPAGAAHVAVTYGYRSRHSTAGQRGPSGRRACHGTIAPGCGGARRSDRACRDWSVVGGRVAGWFCAR